MRPTTSPAVPAATGITLVTGRVGLTGAGQPCGGQSWALAGLAAAAAARAMTAMRSMNWKLLVEPYAALDRSCDGRPRQSARARQWSSAQERRRVWLIDEAGVPKCRTKQLLIQASG